MAFCALVMFAGGLTRVAAAAPAYVTILFGRSNLSVSAGANCTLYSGSVTLDEVAAWLESNGMYGVGTLDPDFTQETADLCAGYTSYPSWQHAATLRDTTGMRFIPQDSSTRSCASLAQFQARGHADAWGMLAIPGGDPDDMVTVANQCYGFIREYKAPPTSKVSATTPPYLVKTLSVTSGKCHNPALACYTLATPFRYTLPGWLSSTLTPASNRYSAVQFYRLVTGARLSGSGPRWDCTSGDPRDHWVTGQYEIYCYVDFKAALLGRDPTAIVTHPAAVAVAWGRVPPVHAPF